MGIQSDSGDVVRRLHATVEGLRSYLVHGERYVVVYYSTIDDRETIHHCQLSSDALPHGLQVGDDISVDVMMGVTVGITRADPPDNAQTQR